MAEIIDQSLLKARLHYDPETGAFTWLVAPNGRIRIGQKAGSPNKDGYIQIKIDRRLYGAHRLAWLYVNGVWALAEIDHKNGVRADNRILNLRPATRLQQMANRKRPRVNTSGFKGVSFHKKAKRWRAYIAIDGKPKHLGYFNEAHEAHAAYRAAAIAKSGQYARAE